MVQEFYLDIFETIYARRAVKYYDKEHKMSEAEQEQLLMASIQTPTAFNIQNWRLVHVKEPELRQQIRKHAWDQAQVTDASMLLVICADLNSWKREPEKYWQNAPQEVQDFLVPAIDDYYRGKEQVQRDEAMRSSGLIGQTIMLAAKGMGYDSCPMDGFDFDKVAEVIHLPKDHVVCFMVAVGKGTKSPWPKPGQIPLKVVVIENTF